MKAKVSTLVATTVNLNWVYASILHKLEAKRRRVQQQQNQMAWEDAAKRPRPIPQQQYQPQQAPQLQQSQLQQQQRYDDENDDYIVQEGEVLEAHDKKNSIYVAIKMIKNRKTFYNQAQTEIKILAHLNKMDELDTKNIVRMRENFDFRHHLCIVYEILSINLYEVLRNSNFKGLELNHVRILSEKILESLNFLAQPNIQVIHCDIKPEKLGLSPRLANIFYSILLRKDGLGLKVIDFGSSCFCKEKAYSYIQSRFYRSPEVILGHPYSVAIDMWSLGCVMVELLLGEPLFSGQTEHDQMCRICDVLGIPPVEFLESGPRNKLAKLFCKGAGDTEYRLIAAKSFRSANKRLSDIVKSKSDSCVQFDRVMYSASTHTIPQQQHQQHQQHQQQQQQQQQQQHLQQQQTAKSKNYATPTDLKNFLNLTERILKQDPKERLTPSQALLHAFFKKTESRSMNTNFTQAHALNPQMTMHYRQAGGLVGGHTV